MDEGFENLSKVYADILADFVNYTKKNHKTSYRNMYFMNQYGSKVEGNWAYSPNEYLLLITNVVPLLLGTFAETCSLNLPQKGRKAGHDCLWAVA